MQGIVGFWFNCQHWSCHWVGCHGIMLDPGKKRSIEALWRDFFSNTSQWWDHRPEKVNPRFPDFRHKQTQESLWVNNVRNPPWVQLELAAIPPGTLQSDAFAWARRLQRLVKAEQYTKTMEVFNQMQQERVCPDTWTFLPVLNACARLGDLDEGKRVHKQIIGIGCELDIYVATCLIDMYGKCRSIDDAWSLFEKMHERNVVTWNTMIGAYVKSGQGLKAMELFQKMQEEAVEPNTITFVGLLTACASVAALDEGRRVHTLTIQFGCESDVSVSTCLVDMYVKCQSVEDAWTVFNKMGGHNLVTWNAMIGGLGKSGQGLRAMQVFRKMQQEGVEPDSVTFVGVLNACASVAALEEGRQVHTEVKKSGCESDIYVATCLVDMYAKCGSIEDAWSVFDKMQEHDVVSWSAIIGGYAKSGQGLKAIHLFQEMLLERVEPDLITFVEVLNACASVMALEEGRRVHKLVIQVGCASDVRVASCLVDMYAKCGRVKDAWTVFNKMHKHDVVTWNAMIGGYVKSGQALKALELFEKMQRGVEPDGVTFVAVLNACASVAALEEGRRVHAQIIQVAYESDVFVANCLVDMYAKCGSIEDASNVFNKMEQRDVVTWNSMIGGYALHGQIQKAIRLFKRMVQDGVKINGITFICLLSACSHGGLVKEGLRYLKSMNACFNLLPTMEHNVCMIDLFGRAGLLDDAEELVKRMPLEKDVSVWTSLLGSCRIYGNVEMAERTAQHCWELDPGNASGHVLLSNIYAAARKWDSRAPVREKSLEREGVERARLHLDQSV